MIDTTLKNNVNRTFKMRDCTITKYKEVIDIAMRKSLADGFILRSYFETLAKNFKMNYAILTYLERLDVIKKIGENKFHFIRPVTITDIKQMGKNQMIANIKHRQKKLKNAEQMTIETSVPNVNVITTDSDEFAAQAMAYLESRGFKVTKDRLNFPIDSYRGSIKALTANVYENDLRTLVLKLAKMERDHIYLAYRACESGKYKSPEQYLKDEYNDFTA